MSHRLTRLDVLAWIVAGFTFLMIVAGGLVTTMQAGDSVPDWPLSYGELYPEKEFSGGVVYEHSHRMIGWAIGFLTIVLLGGLFAGDHPGRLRRLGALAFLAVLVQGGLGGLRVLVVSQPAVQTYVRGLLDAGHDLSPVRIGIAIVHAALAQTVLCLFVGLALVASPAWRAEGGAVESRHARKLRRLGWLTVAFAFVQLVLGGFARHTGLSLWIYVHLGWAFVVVIHVALLTVRARIDEAAPSALTRPAFLLAVLAGVQVALGLGSWYARVQTEGYLGDLPLWAATLRTSHVAIGALLLATALVVTLSGQRWLRPVEVAG